MNVIRMFTPLQANYASAETRRWTEHEARRPRLCAKQGLLQRCVERFLAEPHPHQSVVQRLASKRSASQPTIDQNTRACVRYIVDVNARTAGDRADFPDCRSERLQPHVESFQLDFVGIVRDPSVQAPEELERSDSTDRH